MTWSQAFVAYLKRHKIRAGEAAFVLNVQPSTVHYWTRGAEPVGKKGHAMKRRVEVWSRGEIPAAPWKLPSTSDSDVGEENRNNHRTAS